MSETKKKVITRFIATVLFFVMSIGIVFGQDTETVVFGPETYTREKKKPETVEGTFSVSNLNGDFKIYVQNGNSKKTRVSSGSIVINDVEVVGENEFNKQVENIEKAITGIQKENIIKVTLRSTPGSFLIIKITGTGQYVQPTLIWQKDFNTEITNVPPTFPLKYVVTKDSIKFLDENGNIKKEISLKYVEGDDLDSARVLPSKQGRYIMLLTPLEVSSGEEGKGRDVLKSKYTFMNDMGEVLWEKEEFEGTNMSVIPIPSDTGNNFVSSSFWSGQLCFYNYQGSLIRKIVPYETDIASGYTEISNNGNYFIDANQDPAILVCFNIIGEELWRRTLGDWVGAMSISPNDNYIAAISHAQDEWDKIYLYDLNGNLIWSREGGDDIIKFSADGNYLGNIGSQIDIIETQTGNLLWNYRGEEDVYFRDISVSYNGNYTAVSGTTYIDIDNNGPRYVYLFDKQGNKIWQKEYSQEGYTSWEQAPKVLISEDESKLIITEKKDLFYYTLK